METQRILEARNEQLMLQPEWRSRYSSLHRILSVGDGNCSFTLCLATTFGAATNIVATTLDSRSVFFQKYGVEGEKNTFKLLRSGALVFHNFDACKMATQYKDLLGGIQMSYFDRIIFNFPHAGFLGREDDAQVMEKHKELVRLFFVNARHMLLPGGQVHVSHKLGHPYDEWKLEEQAQVSGLRLVERVPFHQDHFPGYQNCRGDGSRAGKPFPLGPADTYIFEARIVLPLGMSSTIMVHLKSLKQAIRKARASPVTPLQKVVADEVARLEELKDEEKLGKKKMKTLETLKSALQETNVENLENLENFQLVEASVEALAQDLWIFHEEVNEKIIDVDMAVSASLSSRAANIESLGSQSSGCTKPLSPETVDRLFPVNPGNEVFEKAEDATKFYDILEPSPQFSKVSAAETTIDKVEEDVKGDCQQEFQLPGMQLRDDVAPLLRKKESSDLEESSDSLNEKLQAGCLTVLPYLWEVLWRHLQGI